MVLVVAIDHVGGFCMHILLAMGTRHHEHKRCDILTMRFIEVWNCRLDLLYDSDDTNGSLAVNKALRAGHGMRQVNGNRPVSVQ